jgi:hypothetical protein
MKRLTGPRRDTGRSEASSASRRPCPAAARARTTPPLTRPPTTPRLRHRRRGLESLRERCAGGGGARVADDTPGEPAARYRSGEAPLSSTARPLHPRHACGPLPRCHRTQGRYRLPCPCGFRTSGGLRRCSYLALFWVRKDPPAPARAPDCQLHSARRVFRLQLIALEPHPCAPFIPTGVRLLSLERDTPTLQMAYLWLVSGLSPAYLWLISGPRRAPKIGPLWAKWAGAYRADAGRRV